MVSLTTVFSGVYFSIGLVALVLSALTLLLISATKSRLKADRRNAKSYHYLTALGAAGLSLGTGYCTATITRFLPASLVPEPFDDEGNDVTTNNGSFLESETFLKFSAQICAILNFPFAFGGSLEHLVLLIVALDRLYAIWSPLKYPLISARYKRAFVLVAAVLSLIAATISVVDIEPDAEIECYIAAGYSPLFLSVWSGMVIGICYIVCILYGIVLVLVKRKCKNLKEASANDKSPSSPSDIQLALEIQATGTMTKVFFSYLSTTVLGISLSYVLPGIFPVIANDEIASGIFRGAGAFLLALNAPANFFIYAWKDKDLNETFTKFLSQRGFRVKLSIRRIEFNPKFISIGVEQPNHCPAKLDIASANAAEKDLDLKRKHVVVGQSENKIWNKSMRKNNGHRGMPRPAKIVAWISNDAQVNNQRSNQVANKPTGTAVGRKSMPTVQQIQLEDLQRPGNPDIPEISSNCQRLNSRYSNASM